jgi:hypothetical protein
MADLDSSGAKRPRTDAPASAATAASFRKPRGKSLHIGLDAVDPTHYGGWMGKLSACVNDARDMCTLARNQGFKTQTLVNQSATYEAVLLYIREAAKELLPRDMFLLTYSGHGGQMPDVNDEEADGYDETWCLYDRQLVDDRIYDELSKFDKGVYILVISDSCHSGTVVKAAPPYVAAEGSVVAGELRLPRLMPPLVAVKVYATHKAMYDKDQRTVDVIVLRNNVAVDRETRKKEVSLPAIILISGCQDTQLSMDGQHNSCFTEALLQERW